MNRAGKKSFYKSKNCPSTANLLLYAAEKLTAKEDCRLTKHLDQCEFCAAETQLLIAFPPLQEISPPVEIPINIRLFAELMLGKPPAPRL